MAPDPRYLATAIEGALAAGRIHRAYFRQDPPIDKKGPIDLVTAADLAVEREFRALVGRRFPDHVVLGEEYGDAGREGACRWIIDPLDGTTNFAHGLALFSVSIALEIEGHVEIGVVFDPVAEELYTAERGEGARLNGRRLRVTPTATLSECLLCTGFPYTVREKPARQVLVFASFLREARAVRRLGSAALDLCYIAAGRFDGFWEDGLQAWDVAAGALIVEEAGGQVTDLVGGPLDLRAGRIVASNGAVHGAMLQVIDAAEGS